MLTTNSVFATHLTLQEMLPNRSQSKGAFIVFLINHIDAQHVTERSFYTEIITGHVNNLGAVWCCFYIYIYIYIHTVHGVLLVN